VLSTPPLQQIGILERMVAAQTLVVTSERDISVLSRGFELSLRARNRSQKTITGYLQSVELFRQFLEESGIPTAVDMIERQYVEAFVADQLQRWKPKTAQVRYGDVRQFFNWCVEEGECAAHPMARMKPPAVPEVPVPVIPDADLKRLFKACEGTTYEKRRDSAMLRLLHECGLRLGELTGLMVDDVDFDSQAVVVLGKGRRPRAVPFNNKTAQALDRYLRARRSHPEHALSNLWLGGKGKLTDSGVTQVLRRRCRDAGIEPVHPHQLRHTAVNAWLTVGGSETDAMRIFGWKSRQMLSRYAASAADERARESFRRLAPGDRL
jgi:site-specific recombinase XerD